MPKRQVWIDEHIDLVVVPAVYEIRVQGRLDSDYWSQWFDGMIVTVINGETLLRGPVADQAALYGLISRLRDLALPLLSVRIIEADGQAVTTSGLMAIARGLTATQQRQLRRKYQELTRKEIHAMTRQRGNFNWGLIPIYLLVTGGLIAITVYLCDDLRVHEALALTMLFIMMGGLAYGFSFAPRGGGWGWRIPAAIGWVLALISLVVFVTDSGMVPVALALAVLFFLAAGGLYYLFFWRKIGTHPMGDRPNVEWENLGDRSPAERDVPPPANG